MTTLTFRARRRDIAITAALEAAPLYRGRILRGLIVPCERVEDDADHRDPPLPSEVR